MAHDIVLSSGFLAFARHLGVLGAIEDAGLDVDGVCGTSSGALIGALWAAGHASKDLVTDLQDLRPFSLMEMHGRPWRGIFSLRPLITHLEARLPATFEGLQRPLAIGVRRRDGSHALLTSGPLPIAVAASCAMPGVFHPIDFAGEDLVDGGAVDRLGLGAWRALRGDRPTLVHEVARTAGRDVEISDACAIWIRTPRSRASFWSLKDFATQRDEAHAIAEAVLSQLGPET